MAHLLHRVLTLVLLAALALAGPGPARADGSDRWARLSESFRQGIQLRRVVHSMQQSGQVRVAHPEVARRFSEELSQKLGRTVQIPARRIIQVEFDSPAYHQLQAALASSLGVGIYPSARWGHSKLRVGQVITDAVPGGASPFPSTGTRARVVPFGGMHRRFYEAVFTGDSASIVAAERKAHELAGQRAQRGMGCTSYVTKILREHLEGPAAQGTANGAGQPKPYDGKLQSLLPSETSAGVLWRKAAAASPALIIVYTPRGDYRSVTHPDFRFDYTTRPGE